MFTDLAALLLAFFALRVATRPATWKWTYGFDRVSILAAFVNGLALFVVAGMILVEAVERLMDPARSGRRADACRGGRRACGQHRRLRLLLHGGARDNLNMRGAVLHVMGDLLGSVAAIAWARSSSWRRVSCPSTPSFRCSWQC